jgi:N-acetylglutamate synthase-like GNAT family acetyltransferase
MVRRSRESESLEVHDFQMIDDWIPACVGITTLAAY